MLLTPMLVLALGSVGLVAPPGASATPPPAATPGASAAAQGDDAGAAGAVVSPGAEVTPKVVRRAVAEIKSSGTPYQEVNRGGKDYVVVEFGTGSTLALPATGAKAGGQNIGGGGGLFDPYVRFSRLDQSALLAGGGAALAGAICLIPAVGQVACVVAATLVAIAGVYLNAYGRCSTSRPNLRIYVYPNDRSKNGCYR